MIDFMMGIRRRASELSAAGPGLCQQLPRNQPFLLGILRSRAIRAGFSRDSRRPERVRNFRSSPEVDDHAGLKANRGGIEVEGGRGPVGLLDALRTAQPEIERGAGPKSHVR